MPTRRTHGGRFSDGFSLVEILIVLALLGILLSLATPSYRGFINRAHRTEAIGQLLQIAACQERVRSSIGSYDRGRCLPAPSERYRFSFLEPGDSRGQYFRVVAEPQGPQILDPCGGLILDSLGQQSVQLPAANPQHCWSSR